MDAKKSIIEFMDEHKKNIESVSFETLCETTYCYKIKIIGNIKFKNVIKEIEDKQISYTYNNKSVVLSIGLDSGSYERYVIATITYLNDLLKMVNEKGIMVLDTFK